MESVGLWTGLSLQLRILATVLPIFRPFVTIWHARLAECGGGGSPVENSLPAFALWVLRTDS